MSGFLKTFFGVGVVVGMTLLAVGFFLFLFQEPYRLCIAVGTLLCATGCGYAQICEEEPKDESTGED